MKFDPLDPRAMRRFFTAVRASLRGVRSSPMIFLLSVTTMAAGLLMLSAYLLVVQNMRSVLQTVGKDLTVVAFLEPGRAPTPDEVLDLDRAFKALDGVEGVAYVGRDQALTRLRGDLGADAPILEGITENPLPASFEIRLKTAARTPGKVRELARSARRVESVEDVRYGEAWVEGYSSVLRALEWIGAGLGACLVLVLGVIVAGTVRLAVFARSDEIQIQRLVGGGGLFIRLPFYLEGALQGAVGAALAIGALYGLYRLALPSAGDAVHLLLGRAAPAFFGPGEMAALVLVGVGLGVGGAVLSLLRLEESH